MLMLIAILMRKNFCQDKKKQAYILIFIAVLQLD